MKIMSFALAALVIIIGVWFISNVDQLIQPSLEKQEGTETTGEQTVDLDTNIPTSANNKMKDLILDPDIKDMFDIEGKSYVIKSDGGLYERNPTTGELTFVVEYYKPNFQEVNYTKEGNKIFIVSDGQKYLVEPAFKEDFESRETFDDLFFLAGGPWTKMNIISPDAPNNNEATKLQTCIIKKAGCDFKDNRIDLESKVVHTGGKSLKFTTVDSTRKVPVIKSSIISEFLYFKKGDDVWFSGWFYSEKGRPTTILDFKSNWLFGVPGIRLIMGPERFLYVELKADGKPNWRQTKGKGIVFPSGRWVNIKFHFVLDERDGAIELWQDGIKIVDGRGQTIPLDVTIYNMLEIGISATSEDTILYIDDIVVSNKKI